MPAGPLSHGGAKSFSGSRLPAWSAWVAAVAALAQSVLLALLVIPSGFFSLEGGMIIAIPAALFGLDPRRQHRPTTLRTTIKGSNELVAN
jgi:hypothetical protein